jgi:alpha-L-fucosidase
MKKLLVFILISYISLYAQDFTKEPGTQKDARMKWWREARFGLFIHWGLYAVPAGEWNGKTDYGEWIRTSAKIPLEEYDKFLSQFNPVKFNATEWVKMAKDAGMKYIVITSKHHDGFQLFDSKQSDFNVMSTPFKRDVLKELAEACRKEGLKMCWYHSIMDWHHPDYLPRREWEKTRSSEGADFKRYFEYMKAQLKELLTNYGDISVLWFDGEWENTWNTNYGRELYNYVRSLQPDIIINNRVGAGRSGMEGFTKDGEFSGDFGTPEQTIPATGLPGVDWETCMTMNDHWGYNKNDRNWKSAKEILQMLADIASKGGNYLLNVGPTAEGIFPRESVDRLKEIGSWMRVNGESIYGTEASPFNKLDWGRCTKKTIGNDTRLYLHVFNWPGDGKLAVPGIFNKVKRASLLSNPEKELETARHEDAIIINIPDAAPDSVNSVIILDLSGKEDINNPPVIENSINQFIDTIDVAIRSNRENVQIHYTLDGSTPDSGSPVVNGPVRLTDCALISARCFRNGVPVSGTISATFTKVFPEPAEKPENISNGIRYSYFEGDWDALPDFSKLTDRKNGTLPNFDLSPRIQDERFGFEFTGFINVLKNDVYSFYTDSDDGSNLFIGDKPVVDNDGLHGMSQKRGLIPLSAGYHPIRVRYFNKTGGLGLKIYFEGGGMKKQLIPRELLFLIR